MNLAGETEVLGENLPRRRYFYKQTKEYEGNRKSEFLILPRRHLNYPYEV
jgi:hypothetical protein